ncbi:MAG: D-alanine--D-alanine ligase [Candidatus Bostrichicola ureolyticus]|nr:MAG: D-alanine--D-alanine ligase [Candidatus Bostrichicola ureolyticus]
MKNVAIIMVGYSNECSISLQSGQTIFNNINRNIFNPFKILLLKDKWILIDNNKEYKINKHNFTADINGKILKFDIVYNIIHGSPGEDGQLKAYFNILKIPCTWCNFHQSALTINKNLCKIFLNSFGINTAPSLLLYNNIKLSIEKIIKKVGLPCIVKPNKSGSSLGISKVDKKNELLFAINKAFKEDNEIIIESFLEGIEISVGVLTYKNEIIILPITEIISENVFFDYEAKYLGKSKEITPARISYSTEQKVKKIAKKVYSILNMYELSRSEYIIVNGEPYFLEMNTIPGFSENSIFPKQLKIKGISISEIINNAIYISLKMIKQIKN